MNPADPTDKSGKVFDISRPHTAPPPPTSRPVVTGGSPQQDPMVKSEPQKTDASPVTGTPDVPQSLMTTMEETSPHEAAATQEAINQAQQSESATSNVAQVPTSTAAQAAVSSDTAAETPAPIGQEKSSQIVVARHAHSGRFWRRTWFMALLLVLLVIAVDIMLDAGVLKNSSSSIPHTHFFHR